MIPKGPKVADETRDVRPLSMRAAVQPSSINEEARTVELVWTTGEKVLRNSWVDGSFYEELSLDPAHVRMERLNSGRAPLLANHSSRNLEDVIGVIEFASVGTARVRFAKGDAAADAAWNKVRQGILPNVSVGYRVHKFEKVEGGDSKVPTFRATDWEPHEVSIVPMGADSAAHVRSEADLNPCLFISRGQPQQESITMEDIKNPPAAPAVDVEAIKAETLRTERERSSGIRLAVRAAGLGEEVAEKMISDNTSLDKARAFALEELAKRNDAVKTEQHVKIEVGEGAGEKFVRGATAALIERSGAMPTIELAIKRGAKGFEKFDTDGGEFRGMSPTDLARYFLEARGISVRGMDKLEMFKRAFNYRSGYHGTSDFAVLFENVMHKTLLGAYATADDTWRSFCKVDSVSDFRDSNRFRTGSFGAMDTVAEGGEFKNKAIPDGEKKTISTETKGNIISLSRQAVINDDMGALSDLVQKLGRGMALSIELEVYALLRENSGAGPTQSDSQAFFYTSRGNIGSASALTVAAVDADRVLMASQLDQSSNDYLALRPKVMVCGIGQGSAARVLNQAQYDPESNKFQKPNAVAGMFSQIVDTPRVAGTKRYYFADPNVAPAMVVAFLNGQQTPFLESDEGWRVDGTEWKVRHDFKAQMFDPKGALYNAGA